MAEPGGLITPEPRERSDKPLHQGMCLYGLRGGISAFAQWKLFLRGDHEGGFGGLFLKKRVGSASSHKDRARSCPRCMSPMPYVEVAGSMRDWSPSARCWVCETCPVKMIDGKISEDPSLWRDKQQMEQGSRILEVLRSAVDQKK